MLSRVGNRFHSIYFRILIGFLIVVVLLYGISIAVYTVGVANARSAAAKEMADRARFHLRSFEAELRQVMSIQRSYFNNHQLQLLSIADATSIGLEETTVLLDAQSTLQTLMELSSTVRNASIHLPVINKTVSLESGIRPLAAAEFLALATDRRDHRSAVSEWEGRLFLHVPFPLAPTQSRPLPFFSVTVELSRPAVTETLRGMSPAGGGALLHGGNGSWAVSYPPGGLPATGIPDHGFAQLVSWDAEQPTRIREGGTTYLVSGHGSSLLGVSLLVYVPESQIIRPGGELAGWFWAVSICAVFLSVVFSYWIYRIMIVPLGKLADGFEAVEKGNLTICLTHPRHDEFHSLYAAFGTMVSTLDRVVHEASEQRSRARYAELKQLQYQINPHFLHNSIFSIKRIARRHHDPALTNLIELLGRYFEFITRSLHDVISLEEEVEHTRNYIEIQQIRFGSRVRAVLGDLPADLVHFAVPRLVLQPVVENAYEHGLADRMTNGELLVRFEEHDAAVRIVVEDNGAALSDQTLRALQTITAATTDSADSSGLFNVHRRLQLHYGGESGLTFSRADSGGLRVVVVMAREME